MNPPSRIQVGARNYHVVRESKRLVEHDAVGLCVGRYAEIALHPDQDPQTLRETTLHEVLHAIFYDVDSGNEWITGELEEQIVQRLAPRLLDTLRRNPRLMAYLLAHE